jgi:hypothetical protein
VFSRLMRLRQRGTYAFAMAPVAAIAASAPLVAGPLPVSETGLVDPTAAAEAHIPRWRRPSVQAARLDKGLPPEQPAPVMRFNAPPPLGMERRIVAYRLVRVADSPDDVASQELGRLDRGDEVELLERSLAFARVRAPSGLEGWVVASTLDALPEAPEFNAAGEPAAGSPGGQHAAQSAPGADDTLPVWARPRTSTVPDGPVPGEPRGEDEPMPSGEGGSARDATRRGPARTEHPPGA